MDNIIEVLKGKHNFIIDKNNTLQERRVHLDIGRKYFTKQWILKLIDYMNFLKLNTLTLHFSENKGFRIESSNFPEIVSKKHLTKNEIKEIIQYANERNIEVMPSLDTPGHTRQILSKFPHYGQKDINGNPSKESLSITSSKTLAFIKKLYEEYCELFAGAKNFHIGGDEFMEFEKVEFIQNYMPVLNNYAKNTLGEQFSWKDSFANYINEIAKLIYDKGFTPRAWNDGLYYGEHNEDIKQKIKMFKEIEVDFWCQMPWNPSISKLNTILNKGHKIYNLNSSYFYYVLREEMPEDGRKMNSFDKKNQYKNIYNEWTPGKFFNNDIDDKHPQIKGAAISIWCDNPEIVDENTIFEDVKKELFAFALKTLDYKINENITFEELYCEI
ncbi:family 20 glycosylhydrolase [Helcococcus kunzii]|uniref:family 20 glycosylhydrolase n=1 Tax=Helcococcus kunzii TaxID=40091 RepID=UPI0024ACD988|nr:family 20 glycosylhydrolase [Helcococcus kunzii]